MSEYHCAHCGAELAEGTAILFHDHYYCRDCLDELTVVCENCLTRIWADDDCGDSSRSLCQDCYDRFFMRCDRCGRVVPFDEINYSDEDDDCPLCYQCYTGEERRARTIHDYYYKPDPFFCGDGPRYFGVELELDEGGESDCNAGIILDQANLNGSEIMYAKHDGSLDEGFELVTHPLSFEYHMDEFPWPAVLHEARQLGYLSHRANTCGLHIHVSREAFGETRVTQEPCIARILYFVEKHWEELLKFSRRTPRQLERWAARYGLKENPADILDHAKKGYHAGRYTCVNLENSDTIEFRMFRGTLKLNTLLATLQMVNRICDVALFLSDEDLKAMSWTSFVSGCTQPELVQYLKERRLYINEPIDAEEEV